MEFITTDAFVLFAAAGLLGKIGNALSVILGLGLVIFFHELGHFAVAKWCDVHVERFSIGIGPIIWSRQKGETEYALSALPFGGYVKMLGQDDMDPNQMTSDEIAESPRSYSSKKVWQRMAIISAGVIMNVITGFIFCAIAYGLGVVELAPMVGLVAPGSPAWEAGIKPGDVIEEINGDEIGNFTHLSQAVILSDGPLLIKGVRADGSSFSETVTPRRGAKARMIGTGPTMTSRLLPIMDDPTQIALPGSAAEKASEAFKPGDHVTAVNGHEVQNLYEVSRYSAEFAAEDMVYTVERPADPTVKDSPVSTLEITIPPKKVKSIGLWMAIGPVTSMIKGSLAEQQGMKLGDQIIRVGELEVGKDIDPLRLPIYFADHAGESVEVTVNRQLEGDSNEEVTLTITPADVPGWAERPMTLNEPLPISAIGAGIRILPRISHIVPGSEAAAHDRFEVGQKITKVELLHPDPKNIMADAFGDTTSEEIDLVAETEDGESSGEPNWAFVFDSIQQVPNRQVRVYVQDTKDNSDGFAHLFEKQEVVDDWYVSRRGIRGWSARSNVRTAESVGEAIALGYGYTRNSGISIYMTLKSLFQGNLSPRALSGPLGIAKIGYALADDGMSRLLMFLGFLSVNLAVLNFLPIPILDGGHMVFLIWEAVARRKPSPRVINFAHSIGLIFIISLFVFVLYLDIFVNSVK